ncbi:VWA domain-containing protein [Paraconexibacter sp.]|uniref:vWA domain-containing protein n=1 Tax=Paraconexibacter sp. TaxID=2949640 RepID=UPI003565679E
MSEGPGHGDAVITRLTALATALRARGVRVGSGELVTATRALDAVDAGSREAVRLALRAVLCSRPADLPLFDAAFTEVYGTAEPDARIGPVDLGGGSALALPRVAAPDAPAAPRTSGVEPVVVPAAYSDVELLHDKDFAEYSDAERAAARAVLRELARHGPTRIGRRTRPVRSRGARHPRMDVPGTLRDALRTGGEPLHLARRAPTETSRPLVLLVDVSGSMAPYARMLLQYAQAAVVARSRVEVFAFGTRLTRLTLELRARDPDAALARAAAAVDDWAGGTRIGASLSALNREHGRRLGRGAVVVILSDGWDRGDPGLLADEMARLRRSAHRVIWLNPLKAAPGYEPLAAGMAAALPHTDHFIPGNSLGGIAELAALLSGRLDQHGGGPTS